jgi:hypothetical protein
MGLSRVLNDALANAVGKPSGSEEIGMGFTGSRTLGPNATVSTVQPNPIKVFFDELGFVAELGRGELDSDTTYIALADETGVKRYLTISSTNVVAASATKP